MPIGDVQLQVDDGAKWLLRAEQAPLFLWPGAATPRSVEAQNPLAEKLLAVGEALTPTTAVGGRRSHNNTRADG